MALSHKRDAMPLLLVLLFPLAEIATFILVGGAIGVVRTLGLVVVSAVIGAIMLRDAGVMTALRLQREKGNPAAILVLIPSLRGLLFSKPATGTASAGPAQPNAPRDVIEGDFRRLDRDG
jgi:UPF0716 family protein affecting phage T7 exclusion